ncbi:VOC family protein [Roseomonas sp. NAR14]|uniref:VOC family protein n=1 Tax=Roseomonas acroporae TaxID=2937791 RepID=A0A9X1Y8H5_9PROT|nr:VOC family protein [Roseomonas acroporae]MCK8786094.1 VOC family protein [Roseomonas acroporae]
MRFPDPVFYPPFNITRASHAVLTVRDLAASRDFYTRVIGLVVTEEDADTLYLRGIEEVAHHSLVLRRSDGVPACERVGLRVLTEEELDKAARHFAGLGLPASWAEAPHQGRTLHVSDPFGMPLEFVARMDLAPRRLFQTDHHPGGAALRFDHKQIHVTDVAAACRFYTALGFRTSDYVVAGPEDAMTGAFMHRKDIPWDLVFLPGPGPRLHHFAYVTPSLNDMMRACDAAGLHGYGSSVERGPGRHGQGHVQYVYFRDPDGHRVELVLEAPHNMTDLEQVPVRWDAEKRKGTMDWGYPAPRRWFEEATVFAGVPPTPAGPVPGRVTLEDHLAAWAAG